MLDDFADWLIDLLLWVPRKIWELLLDALAAFINSIPVPSFFSSASQNLASIGADVWYFAQHMQLGYGLSVVLGAYVLRFLIRRLPVVG